MANLDKTYTMEYRDGNNQKMQVTLHPAKATTIVFIGSNDPEGKVDREEIKVPVKLWGDFE